MNPYAIYIEVGAAVVLLAVAVLVGYHFGGMGPKAQLEALKAAQAELTATAVLAERASAEAEVVRVNAILKEYQDAALNPIVPGIAVRLLERACPTSGPLPADSGHPGTPSSSSPQPGSDPGAQRLLQVLVEACAQDADELTALQQAWPR